MAPGDDAAGDPAWPAMTWPARPVRIRPPSPRELTQLRILIVAALAAAAGFLAWFFQPRHVGEPVSFALLAVAVSITLLVWLLELFNYWTIAAPRHRRPRRAYSVDVFTTACPGEPRGMILRTLRAMAAIRYPHTSYLCDEGDDPLLKAACAELGVIHVTRADQRDAKAGNINNALAHSSGEICVVLDPDHEPSPYLLDRVLGHFDDPRVGFVQSIQAYRNQRDTLVARAAAEQSYHFYGPIMMGMHGRGTTQAIGANCVFRRAALDSIGGHAAGLAEDMHTAMRLYGKRWRSVYVPEALTRGLVPADLAAYFKQQLKWSCGTFDLLFGVYPKVVRNFTWWQRLHYLLCPLHFLRGLRDAMFLLVPIWCLVFSVVGWRFDLGELATWLTPAAVMALMVRMRAQKWLLEPGERGLHVLGGLLATGTWWVYLTGFLCAVFRVRVPYIPTPKEGEARNSVKLAAPNLLLAGLSVGAIVYGLERDFTPYSVLMATFAAFNAAVLLATAALAQQRWLEAMRRPTHTARRWMELAARPWRLGHEAALGLMRRRSYACATLALAVLAGTHAVQEATAPPGNHELPWQYLVTSRDTGGFYTGIYLPEPTLDTVPATVTDIQNKHGLNFDIVSMYWFWGDDSLYQFPQETMRSIYARGAIPMVTWEPYMHGFAWVKDHPDLREDRKVFAAILKGTLDYYIIGMAERFRDLGEPIFVRMAHEPDNPQYPWSARGGNTPEEYTAAWRYVVDLFNKVGATNVTWVWSPWRTTDMAHYYPGDGYVDWIGLTTLNYGRAGVDGRWQSFEELYEPFRAWVKHHDLPVMLAEFGTTEYGGDRASWLASALSYVKRRCPEVRALVHFHSDRDRHWPTRWRPATGAEAIDWTFVDDEPAATVVATWHRGLPAPSLQLAESSQEQLWGERKPAAMSTPAVTGEPGSFALTVDGQPFYIRGVAYNVSGDWRDGKLVPTRRQLENDFAAIRAMGANTIRRYGNSAYDHNILTVAAEHDLKVLFGFWLDHDVNYLTDDAKLAALEARVLDTVRRYRDHPAVLGWCLGNEVWGMLHHRFAQPYLAAVRQAHVQFVEQLAVKIKTIDPHHVVMVAHEHSPQLSGALLDFARGAPSVDVIGVNSYYQRDIDELHQLLWQADASRPYIISEFGPDGYWHATYTRQDARGQFLEAPASIKAMLYAQRWERHVQAHAGVNLGGVAYCWRDRFEGTATWFGLSDLEGQFKPAYYALRQAWTGQAAPTSPRVIDLRAVTGWSQGRDVPLHAVVRDASPRATISWRVHGPNFSGHGAALTVSPDDPTHALLRLDGAAGTYRVYVRVTEPADADHAPRYDEINLPITLHRDDPPTAATTLATIDRLLVVKEPR